MGSIQRRLLRQQQQFIKKNIGAIEIGYNNGLQDGVKAASEVFMKQMDKKLEQIREIKGIGDKLYTEIAEVLLFEKD
jgi:flagellar biosynthesis/type III secretory pathway protein FliH